MIVTESKNRKIKICDQILEEIYSQIQKNDYDPEKGGIIVGRENLNNENIILEYISKPLKNDICTRTRYTRKDEGHLKYFEKLYNENNGVYAYWGEWHTHPEDIPHYSIIRRKATNGANANRKYSRKTCLGSQKEQSEGCSLAIQE